MCRVVLIVRNVTLQKILRLSLNLGLRNYGLDTIYKISCIQKQSIWTIGINLQHFYDNGNLLSCQTFQNNVKFGINNAFL